jgi:chromate transporter
LRQQDVLDGLALVSLLPGPVAINLVAYLGYRLRGYAGALLAVAAAMTPAFILMLICSAAYAQWAQQGALSKIFLGVIPVVAAIVLHAAWQLAHGVMTGRRETSLGAAAAVALIYLGGIYASIVIIISAALIGMYCFRKPARSRRKNRAANDDVEGRRDLQFVGDASTRARLAAGAHSSSLSRVETCALWLTGTAGSVGLLASVQQAVLLKLLGVFAGMSLLLFGGAYVFVPLMQQFVESHGWLTSREFSDAVALAQMMPGPLIVVATFIGFKVAGVAGAIVATLGIVTPSTLLVLICAQGFERFRKSPRVAAALRGVRAAVVGMVFAAGLLVGKTAEPGVLAVAIGGVSLFVLLRHRIEPVFLLVCGGVLGLLCY